MKSTNESGRSMIEMLGVLAVIGVLSVGGLLGYKTAMTNHYANETLSDLSKMSVWVSSQRMSNTAGNISSFKKTSPYEITLTDATDPNKKFVLTVANVPEAVCIKILGMNWTVPVITPETCSGTADMTFTFNNDLSTGKNDNNNAGKPCDMNNQCGDGCQECVSGYCKDKCTNGQICAQGTDTNDYTCKTNPCSDCTSNQYCNVASSNYLCSNPDTGSCETLDSGTPSVLGRVGGSTDTATEVVFTPGQFLMGPKLSWWSAKNWCKAHNMELVNLSDLGIDRSNLGNYFANHGMCDSEDPCENVDWGALTQALEISIFWTNDSSDSCRALLVASTGQEIWGYNRNYADPYTLCK